MGVELGAAWRVSWPHSPAYGRSARWGVVVGGPRGICGALRAARASGGDPARATAWWALGGEGVAISVMGPKALARQRFSCVCAGGGAVVLPAVAGRLRGSQGLNPLVKACFRAPLGGTVYAWSWIPTVRGGSLADRTGEGSPPPASTMPYTGPTSSLTPLRRSTSVGDPRRPDTTPTIWGRVKRRDEEVSTGVSPSSLRDEGNRDRYRSRTCRDRLTCGFEFSVIACDRCVTAFVAGWVRDRLTCVFVDSRPKAWPVRDRFLALDSSHCCIATI